MPTFDLRRRNSSRPITFRPSEWAREASRSRRVSSIFSARRPGASRPPPAAAGRLRDRLWSIAALQLDGLQVAVANAPGVIGQVDFRISAAMQNLGAVSGTPAAAAMQKVTITNLEVSTDAEPAITLLQADEAAVKFTMEGLAGRQLEELKLRDPVIDFAPELPVTRTWVRRRRGFPRPPEAALRFRCPPG